MIHFSMSPFSVIVCIIMLKPPIQYNISIIIMYQPYTQLEIVRAHSFWLFIRSATDYVIKIYGNLRKNKTILINDLWAMANMISYITMCECIYVWNNAPRLTTPYNSQCELLLTYGEI